MKSSHLDTAPRVQKFLVQPAQGVKLFGCWLVKETALKQGVSQLGVITLAKFQQPIKQTLAHFTRCFFGESNRQNFVGLGAVKQRPDDARNQHPRFSSTSASLNHHAAFGVASHLVKLRLGNQGSLLGIGNGRVFIAHTAAQKSLRHRPRALQNSQAVASPKAGIGAPALIRCMTLTKPSIKASRA